MNLKLLNRMLSVLLLWATMYIIYIPVVLAQVKSVTVKGVVKEKEGTPIASATVVAQNLKTSKKYAVSCDDAGRFLLPNLPVDGAYSFVVSAIGYQSNTISGYVLKAEGENALEVMLESASQSLNDVVVVGYGKQKRANVTGSISSIKSEDITNYPAANFAESALGKASGVQIVQSSASPGASPQIKVRGTGTLTAGTSPLVVVDGFPMTEGSSLSTIDPNTIASVEFLKDAASTAIYGSRGANGVIMVETKSGIKGKTQVSLNTFYGVQQRADNVQLVDAYEMAQFMLESRNMGYVSKNPTVRSVNDDTKTRLANGASKRELIPDYIIPYLNGEKGLTNTNWLNEVFRTAPMSSLSLNIMGGGEHSTFSVTGNYFNQQGILIGSNYKRYSANINIKSELSKHVTFGFAANPAYTDRNLFGNGSWNEEPLAIAQISYPFFAPYKADGSLNISEQIKANTATDGALAENPVAILKYINQKSQIFRMFGNSYLKVDFLKDFSFKTSLGGDFQSYVQSQYKPSFVGFYRNAAPVNATSNRENNLKYNFLTENVLSYNKEIGKHTVEVLAGQSFQKEMFSNSTINALGFPDDQITNIAGGSAFNSIFNQQEWLLLSYFGRVNYNYDGKYLLAASFRRDGSSRFGQDNKFSTFPAFSAGWVLSKEDFFPKNDIINYAKLRGSWGATGNNQIPNYGAQALLSEQNYVYNGALAPGYGINTPSNSLLSWELSESLDFGLDVSVIHNFLNISADYYVTNTKDLLLNVPVPQQSGYDIALQNIGKIQNTGFELQISTNRDIKLGPVSWTPSFNFSANRNKVLALGAGQNEIISGDAGFSLTRVGGSIAALYGYKTAGIYKSQEQIENTSHIAGTLVGDIINVDVNGDGKIDEKDKMSFGSANPKFIYGVGSTFKYRGFELTFLFNGEAGKKIFSRVLGTIVGSGEGFAVPYKEYYDNRFVPGTLPNGTEATPNLGNYSNNRKANYVSDRNFKDASYLRLRVLRLGYSVPEHIIKVLGIQRAQIYASANNLWTLTPYKGFSVDATSTNPLLQGYDDSNYPVAKSISLGLNVNF